MPIAGLNDVLAVFGVGVVVGGGLWGILRVQLQVRTSRVTIDVEVASGRSTASTPAGSLDQGDAGPDEDRS